MNYKLSTETISVPHSCYLCSHTAGIRLTSKDIAYVDHDTQVAIFTTRCPYCGCSTIIFVSFGQIVYDEATDTYTLTYTRHAYSFAYSHMHYIKKLATKYAGNGDIYDALYNLMCYGVYKKLPTVPSKHRKKLEEAIINTHNNLTTWVLRSLLSQTSLYFPRGMRHLLYELIPNSGFLYCEFLIDVVKSYTKTHGDILSIIDRQCEKENKS